MRISRGSCRSRLRRDFGAGRPSEGLARRRTAARRLSRERPSAPPVHARKPPVARCPQSALSASSGQSGNLERSAESVDLRHCGNSWRVVVRASPLFAQGPAMASDRRCRKIEQSSPRKTGDGVVLIAEASPARPHFDSGQQLEPETGAQRASCTATQQNADPTRKFVPRQRVSARTRSCLPPRPARDRNPPAETRRTCRLPCLCWRSHSSRPRSRGSPACSWDANGAAAGRRKARAARRVTSRIGSYFCRPWIYFISSTTARRE
jgi:hypothetical protein